MSGKRAEALRIVDEFKEPTKRKLLTTLDQAEIYAALGEKERALELLEKAYQERARNFSVIRCWRAFDSLRSEPRFQELVRRVGLPP
jgi:hypothetical protein